MDRAGWHMQAYLSLYVCRSAGGIWNASSNLGRRWVADAVNLHGQFTSSSWSQTSRLEDTISDKRDRRAHLGKWCSNFGSSGDNVFGGWGWWLSSRSVDPGMMKFSVMIPWPEVAVDSSGKARKFRQNRSRPWLSHRFSSDSSGLLRWEPIWICSR